jgi:hypothetical protein
VLVDCLSEESFSSVDVSVFAQQEISRQTQLTQEQGREMSIVLRPSCMSRPLAMKEQPVVDSDTSLSRTLGHSVGPIS